MVTIRTVRESISYRNGAITYHVINFFTAAVGHR